LHGEWGVVGSSRILLMNKTLSLPLSAVVGGVAGALLVWFALRPVAPTTIFIGLNSPSSTKQTLPQSSSVSRANRSGFVIQSSATSKSLDSSSPQLEALINTSPAAEALAGVTYKADVALQNGALHSPTQIITLQPLPSGTEFPERGDSSSFDEALSFALEAADPYEKQGFVPRQDYWDGQLPIGGTHAIVHQLFKGNEYWFWLGTDTPHAQISVHIYDRQGRLVDAEHWQRTMMASARVVPQQTGEYYVLVRIEASPVPLTRWSMAYGFR
jgi:hypothetical protein